MFFPLNDVLDLNQLSHKEEASWEYKFNKIDPVEILGTPTASTIDRDNGILVYYPASVLGGSEKDVIKLSLEWGHLRMTTFCHEYKMGRSLIDKLHELVPTWRPKPPKIDRNLIHVNFWMYDQAQRGANHFGRTVDADSWKDIKGNYPDNCLAKIMDPKFRPGTSGQFILWNGEAGTGKTTAIRTLAREWGDWCSLHYIIDTKLFFDGPADYMTQVILHGGGTWRLLILEDCGELLSSEGKKEVTQALSRLLNICDGLLGRGLNIMVLLTTNEPLGALHEAVARPGRCCSQVEFKPFSVAEANKWLKKQGLDQTVKEPTSLANLYAMSGVKPKKVTSPESSNGRELVEIF